MDKTNNYTIIDKVNNFLADELENKDFVAGSTAILPQNGVSVDFILSKRKNSHSEFRFFKLTSLNYDSEYPRREALENVLSAVGNPGVFNFVYLISGSPAGTDIFFGIARNFSGGKNHLDSSDYGNILKSSILGNFQGSTLLKRDDGQESCTLSIKQIESQIFKPLMKAKRFGLITGVPSLSENENGGTNDNTDYQGMDRLINAMEGATWQMLVVAEPVGQNEITAIQERVYNLYAELYSNSKRSVQKSNSNSQTQTEGENKGTNVSKTIGASESTADGNTSSSSSRSNSKTTTIGTNNAKTTGSSQGSNFSKATGNSSSHSETVEFINKKYQEFATYIDTELIKRLAFGCSKGLFKTATYTFANNRAILERLQNNIMSIFQGDKSSFVPLEVHTLSDRNEKDAKELKEMITSFQILEKKFDVSRTILGDICSIPYDSERLALSTYLTTKEISIVAGLPTKEIPGISIAEGIDFGLNIPQEKEGVDIGYILARGRPLKKSRVNISKEHINKHIFIGGVTGSGKTTTCQKLLIESNFPFLVIEPAKSEYRVLFKECLPHNLSIFTLGAEHIAPFRFNPFELLRGESITSRIDSLKATFIAAFPMEAAMPYIIEEAIYKSYEKYGWDVNSNENMECNDPWMANGLYWPIFSDMLTSLREVVETKGFDARLKNDYIGSLVARFSNLTIGSKGKMLNCRQSVDFEKLLDGGAILELEELKDPREKALMMGFILGRVAEVVKRKHRSQNNYRHITLIEEAHRLLSKTEIGDDGSKKQGVTVFTDMLAEVRKYGESFIIVDQIPNKLTSEVLKNTNTKIIHRLFAKDDKNSVGDTMALSEKQKEYLSLMKVGETVVFSDNWNKAVNVQIEQRTKTNMGDMSNDEIKKIGEQQVFSELVTFFPALAGYENIFSHDEIMAYIKMGSQVVLLAKKIFPSLINEKKLKKTEKPATTLIKRLNSLLEHIETNNRETMLKVIGRDIFLLNPTKLVDNSKEDIPAEFYEKRSELFKVTLQMLLNTNSEEIEVKRDDEDIFILFKEV